MAPCKLIKIAIKLGHIMAAKSLIILLIMGVHYVEITAQISIKTEAKKSKQARNVGSKIKGKGNEN